jgi:hypothetical protein
MGWMSNENIRRLLKDRVLHKKMERILGSDLQQLAWFQITGFGQQDPLSKEWK